MADVEIYTLPTCPYCLRAKALLQKKGIPYTEFDMVGDPAKREEMLARSKGRTSAPQIFINGHGIGGSDDLYALDRKGELDQLLAVSS